jgi:hypothetical protein
MKTILKISILSFIIINKSYAYDNASFISASGSSYSQARTAASKISMSQGMRVIGQNYYQDKSGNWNVTLKVVVNKR